MKIARRMLGLAALGAAAIALSTPVLAQDTRQQVAASSVVEEIKKRGVMRVGLSTFVPWSMRDKKGDLIGFEIDVANKVAADMGVKVEFVPTAWDGIIPALLAGKFDLIISGMTITPARNLTVNFTVPYASSGQAIAANKKLAANLKTIDDFNKAGVTITCRRGSSTCADAKRIFAKATIRELDDDPLTRQEVVNGNAHAVMSSEPKPTMWTLENPDTLFKPFTDTVTKGTEAFALRKGDPDGINFFSNWILFNTNNGWLKDRHDYWFKTNTWAQLVGN